MFFAGLALTSQLLQSCLKAEDLYKEKVTEVTYSELKLGIGGDCDLASNPLTRADVSKRIFGINVMRLVEEKNGSISQKPYAYGIFDNIDQNNLKLNVLDGFNYRISCTMVNEAKDSLVTDNGILAPFVLSRGNNPKLGKVTNKFITTERADGTQEFLVELENPKIGTESQSNYTRPKIQRYHGLIDNLKVTGTGTNVLEVYRRFFGVKFMQNGLQTDCKLEIQLEGAPTVWLTPQQKESPEYLVSMRSLTAVVEAGKIVTDNARVKVIVHRDNGEAEEILNYQVAFKRNYMHTIVISDIDHFGSPSNVSVNVEEEELQNDAQIDLPWQGGK